MNDAKVSVESHKEWLTLSKSNSKVQKYDIGFTANVSNVITQWKWTNYFVKHIKQSKEPETWEKRYKSKLFYV